MSEHLENIRVTDEIDALRTELVQAKERIGELERRLTFGARNSDEVQIYIEEGIRVGCEVAEHEKSLAEARAKELTTVLREMTHVLHSVVTTETFAPPRDVPANTHWQAAGFWIGKARALLDAKGGE